MRSARVELVRGIFFGVNCWSHRLESRNGVCAWSERLEFAPEVASACQRHDVDSNRFQDKLRESSRPLFQNSSPKMMEYQTP